MGNADIYKMLHVSRGNRRHRGGPINCAESRCFPGRRFRNSYQLKEWVGTSNLLGRRRALQRPADHDLAARWDVPEGSLPNEGGHVMSAFE